MTQVDTEPILPVISDDNKPYWKSAREHALTVPFCGACNAAFYPAQSRCPRCLRDGVEWRRVSGRGTVYSWVVVHQVYDPSFAGRIPLTGAHYPRTLSEMFPQALSDNVVLVARKDA